MKEWKVWALKKIISSILVISMLIISFPLQAEASLEDLYAQSAILMDADSGRVLFEKNGVMQRPMASTTKIMTCIVTLETVGMDEIAEVSSEAAAQPKVRLGACAGETYYIKDLLYSLMLESHNDTAVIIAEYVGGSLDGFAEKMNTKAREIGCENTYYITPNGLDSQDVKGVHSTTAKDLASIMRYCINESPQKEQFLEITRTMSYAFTTADGDRSFSCVNHNAFLGMMDGALTGKTGFTNDAGYCYVGALERDGKTFIVALLACGWPNNKNYKWKDTMRLMEYALENYEYRNVWQDVSFDKITVEDGIPESSNFRDTAYTQLGIPDAEEINLLLKADEQVYVDIQQEEKLRAPVEKGQVVGSVKYFLGDQLIRELPITVQKSVDIINFQWCAEKVLERFLGCN